MEQVETLIDRATEKIGSRYKLSKLTGVAQSNLSEMVHGAREIPPALAGELADLLGEDPRAAALAALVEKEKKPERRERLARLFGLSEWRKRLVQGLKCSLIPRMLSHANR